MRLRRTLLVALVAAVIAGPAAAIAVAGSGPSAGDNQYTDPLSTSSAAHTTAPPPPSTTPAPSTTPPAAPAPATASAPTATIASATTSTSSGSSAKTLPVTGYDGWAGALLGAGLLGAGFAVRRRVGAR